MLNGVNGKELVFKLSVLFIVFLIVVAAASRHNGKPEESRKEENSKTEAVYSTPVISEKELTNLPVVVKGGVQDYFHLNQDDLKLFEATTTDNNEIRKTEAIMCNPGKTKAGDSEGYVQALFVDGVEEYRLIYGLKDNQALVLGHIDAGGEKTIFDPPMTVFKYPFKKGDTWEPEGFSIKYETGGEEIVSIPIGKIKAYKLTMSVKFNSEDRSTIDEWYAPGLGLVKRNKERIIDDNKTFESLELKGYRINGKTAGAAVPDKYITRRFAGEDTNPMYKEIKEYLPTDIEIDFVFKEYEPGALIPKSTETIYSTKGMTVVDGKEMLMLVSVREDTDFIPSNEYCHIDGDTVYKISRAMYEKEEMVPVLKFPLKPGKTWEYKGKNAKETFTVKGKEKIKTIAGEFDSVRVDSVFVSLDGKETDYSKSVWYAKGKGRVKQCTRYRQQQGKDREVVEELVEVKDYNQ
ncbi:MAG: hypothetical protein LWY06_09750 [Firmicutes bacterium]|nr:hypothetical protein [Bacillota bacterium]